ncbi:MAG: 50S ribosomal protein L30 [Christensenellales bacterium]|jgi:large subunit ribosomal protein L30
MANKLRITLAGSTIRGTKLQRDTVRALGFTKRGQVVIHDDNPSIRGMIFRVKHLLSVEEISAEEGENA